MRIRHPAGSYLWFFLFPSPIPTQALTIEQDAVFVLIIDTGPRIACVVSMPGDFYMVYDAGHWDPDDKVAREIRRVTPKLVR